MIRNLKALGLALVAVFALSATTASAASAQTQGTLTTSDGTAKTLLGTVDEDFLTGNSFTAFKEVVECTKTLYTGHKWNVTPHEAVPHKATTATITPHYSDCFAFPGELPATVFLNGCDYVVHIGETTGLSGNEYKATADIVCPPNKTIQIGVYSSSTHGLLLCTLDVMSATGVGGAEWVHNKAGEGDDIDLAGTFKPFTVVKSGLCGSATDKEGKLDVNTTIEASDGTAVTITH
ncbi:MAG TPA: hypothetical protein VFM94_05390 [Solirubrobacterales bacterium]|nr:hypothetical protein [Solirubrobacterales bacterium]